MLLFADGFECFSHNDLWRKWGHAQFDITYNSTQSLYDESGVKIVFGDDTTRNPVQPKARHERALAVRDICVLGTPIRKSRTVFCGFALRTFTDVSIDIFFTTDVYPFRHGGSCADLRQWSSSVGTPYCAKCNFTIKSDKIEPTWTFPHWSLTSQYGQIYSNTDLRSGDWYYYQLGFTLLGSDETNPQGWVENRIGNREHKRWKAENINTCVDGNNESFFVNGVSFRFNSGSNDWFYLDDFYITNDEGDVNNGFLGNVAVRTVTPTGSGVTNDTVIVGGETGLRDDNVDLGSDGLCDTYHSLPTPLPTPAEEPEFLEWKDPTTSCLRFDREENTQLLRFSDVNFAGSEPYIFGLSITHMSRPHSWGPRPSQLFPFIKTGEKLTFGIDDFAPIIGSHYDMAALMWDSIYSIYFYPYYSQTNEDGDQYYFYSNIDNNTGFELRQCFIENSGDDPTVWNTTALNASEYGLKLAPWDGDVATYSHNAARYNITINIDIDDGLNLYDIASRHLEELMAETLDLDVSWSMADWGATSYDGMHFSDNGIASRFVNPYVEDVVYLKDEYPWIYNQMSSISHFEDTAIFAWNMLIEDSFALGDWSTPWHYEEVFSDLDSSDANISTVATIAFDGLTIESSDVWDNHFDISEIVAINVSYIFSGHELLSEYLDALDFARCGYGADVYDSLEISLEDFGGNWVQFDNFDLGFSDSVLTQHWRYDWVMGYCVSSWQIDPIEDRNGDYSRTGEYDDGS